MTYIVALTGGICSGKTTISNSFKKIGIHVVDSDVISKKIIENNFLVFNAIKKKFGRKVLNIDNSINRSVLKKYIFYNKNNKLWLENLLHPKIYKESQLQIKSKKSVWCLWVVPLLIEKKLEKRVNRILLVDAPIKVQIKRMIQRDKINSEEAKKIVSLQSTRYERISVSDDIIYNNEKIHKLDWYSYYFDSLYTLLSKKNKKLKNFKKNKLTIFH
ncbi:dephospho-CoA kinase [Buchnera aphidicola (Muscaphis stroyani)]|uniref:Dephospho-CoA kinase n=1 Tax=Buchnera aphidicola (Muscaphis stroyani) TaxID=1241869 RepID=A0A4D6YCP2_9GAMM|nr:dephospho-CoA kinase [Buchnera aphidicola]QCI24291.1 dephospho-CoA kinase [Buchnera aphidicola (Muscaphis stroyani)]